MGLRWHYRLHGFGLTSEFELPELVRDEQGGDAADVVLRVGRVPERLDAAREQGACYAAAPGEMLFWLPGVARFHVAAGREIVVDPQPGAAGETLRSLVLSSPLAALLLQRGLLPLHASAVATPKGAAVFAGSAGLGKSTLAAAWHRQRGLVPLSDDISALRVGENEPPAVLPGYPALRLWPDAHRALGVEADGPTLRPGVAKKLVALAVSFPREPVPLAAVYILDQRELPPGAAAPGPFSGAEALAAILDVIYRPAFVRGMGLERRVFAQAAALARTARIAPWLRPPGRFDPAGRGPNVFENPLQ
ncbi:MAG TPA: hypothetical protein VNW30_08240 [Opitutaceae bacterium]|jgi:hypothetical protein|nr:hypothetical protein [Opitutaceae bacterium]